MAITFGVLSIVLTSKEDAQLFNSFTSIDHRIETLTEISKKSNHIFMMEEDETTYDDFKENVLCFRELILSNLNICPDLFIIQSSKDGFHLVSPFIMSFEDINTLMSFFPQDYDPKGYPTLTTRDYDYFATLRIMPKYNNYGSIIKGKPILKEIILGNISNPTVSKGHLKLFRLTPFNDYNMIPTYPILVKYKTDHRVD